MLWLQTDVGGLVNLQLVEGLGIDSDEEGVHVRFVTGSNDGRLFSGTEQDCREYVRKLTRLLPNASLGDVLLHADVMKD